MLKRTHVRSAFLVMIATVVLGAPVTANSQAADKEEVVQIVRQARGCRTDEACRETCMSASEQRDSTEFRGLADKCSELYLAFTQRRAQIIADASDGSILKDGYSWMMDVDAVVGSRPIMGRRYPLVAEGHEDWRRNCSGRTPVKYLFDVPVPIELRIPGTKVQLKRVQYKDGHCIIGQVEILGK